ncbi:choice-of-anchor Q domain-containing protein [Chloroflexota bacterium]
MKRSLVILLVCFLALLLPAQTGLLVPALANGDVLYVKPGAGGDCSSWASACELQTALAGPEAGDEIWVAEGTYRPTTGTSRTATFQLVSGVDLYGGFAGTETSRSQRDWVAHPTVLSGDLNGDDGSCLQNNGENSYHVVTGSGVDVSTRLAGFTVRGGNANGADPHDSGGGMYIMLGSPSLEHVTFYCNSAAGGGGMNNVASNPKLNHVTFYSNSAAYGGGMRNFGSSSPSLDSVTFSFNSAFGGGGLFNDGSSPTLTGVAFKDNSASFGGGIYNYNSSPLLNRTSFIFNSATTNGGAVYNGQLSAPAVRNTSFSRNTALSGGGIFSDDSSPTLVNVTFSGNTALDCGGGMCSTNGSNSVVVNGILWDNSPDQVGNDASTTTVNYSDVQGGHAGTGNIDDDPLFVDATNPDGRLPLQLASPAIDAGDNTAVPWGVTTDLDGAPRFFGFISVTDKGNGTPPIVDMGAHETQGRAYLPLVLRRSP